MIHRVLANLQLKGASWICSDPLRSRVLAEVVVCVFGVATFNWSFARRARQCGQLRRLFAELHGGTFTRSLRFSCVSTSVAYRLYLPHQ